MLPRDFLRNPIFSTMLIHSTLHQCFEKQRNFFLLFIDTRTRNFWNWINYPLTNWCIYIRSEHKYIHGQSKQKFSRKRFIKYTLFMSNTIALDPNEQATQDVEPIVNKRSSLTKQRTLKNYADMLFHDATSLQTMGKNI